jgi:endonuclease/exonuclease/phosphatase family metal-dependent hydrolase
MNKNTIQLLLVVGVSLILCFGIYRIYRRSVPPTPPKTAVNPPILTQFPTSDSVSQGTPQQYQKGARLPRGKKDELMILSWNLYNFGRTKTPEQFKLVAQTVRNFDIVAIQEVSTSEAGARAVAQLADELDRTGANWDYVVSDATSGAGSERYAYLWNSSRVKLKNKAFLCTPLEATINREPFMARFETPIKKTVLLGSFHAVPAAKKPATEIEQLVQLHTLYTADNLLFMGDFNYSGKKPAFDGVKQQGYAPALVNTPTSLKRKPNANGNYLNEEYDNIFYETAAMEILQSDKIDVVPLFQTFEDARTLSDHLPVWIKIRVK